MKCSFPPPSSTDGRVLCDSMFLENILPDADADRLLGLLMSEDWQTMQHRGGAVPRLISLQANPNEEGDMPVYRHPTDQFLPGTF